MRTVYLGTTEFAVTVLRRLAASPHRPALVVTPPDRPRGRGRRVGAAGGGPPGRGGGGGGPRGGRRPAGELGLELSQAESVNDPDVVERVRAAAPELGVVCAFGQLISDPLLSELVMLNVHPSLLPRWRGAAPIERAIMAGDPETGVTIIRVAAGYDSGPIALRERVPIEADDDYGSLAARLAELGGRLVVRALDAFEAGELEFSEQDESLATYAERIGPAERRLDPARPAAELERVVRALNPHLRPYLELDGGERLAVRVAAAEPGELEPGRLAVWGGALRLGCGEGVLRLELVQPAGGRPMAAESYLRGHPAPRLAG